MSNKIFGHILAFLSVFFWSALYVCTKILLSVFSPLELLLLQSIMGYIFLFILKPNILILSFKNELSLAFCGLFGVSVYNLFLNLAMEKTFASNVSIIIATAPLFTAIFSFIFKIDKIYLNFFIGFVISILGISLLSFSNGIDGINILGDILAVISAAGWGLYAVLVAKVMKLKVNLLIITRKILFYGILFTLPTFLFLDFNLNLAAFDLKISLNLFFVALFASCLCFIMWNKATNIIGAIKTNIYVYLTPVITIAVSFIILDEVLNVLALCGVLLTIIGVIISQKR